MKSITIGMLLLAMMFLTYTVDAHPDGRIKQGVKTGQLTPREAKMLRVQKAHVRTLKQVARADGRITPRERVIINRSQRNLSRNIYRQKHDMNIRRSCR